MTASKSITETDYFANRNVSEHTYKKYKLPAYLMHELNGNTQLSILYIGCGLGQMMHALIEKGYKNVSGLDISTEAVNACRAQGLSVEQINSLTEYCSKPTPTYDVIIMSHVLEHIDKDQIVATVKLIKQHLLKPGGRFILMVPNAQSNTNAYWAYEDFTHTTLFTAGSIHYVLKSAGFTTITFLDPKGIAGFNPILQFGFSILLWMYKTNKAFWNLVTLSSYHKPSPQIFTYELKVKAE